MSDSEGDSQDISQLGRDLKLVPLVGCNGCKFLPPIHGKEKSQSEHRELIYRQFQATKQCHGPSFAKGKNDTLED